jgi:hypothetical protein
MCVICVYVRQVGGQLPCQQSRYLGTNKMTLHKRNGKSKLSIYWIRSLRFNYDTIYKFRVYFERIPYNPQNFHIWDTSSSKV